MSPVDLSKRTGKVAAGFTGSPDRTAPPVTPAELNLKKTVMDESIIKADKGGSLATARRNALRADMVVTLNQDAS